MMALVVAMAGMMLPAYSGARHQRDARWGRERGRTLDLEPRLRLDVESGSAQVGSGNDEIERVIVVLVERDRVGLVDAEGESFDAAIEARQLGAFRTQRGRERTDLETKRANESARLSGR